MIYGAEKHRKMRSPVHLPGTISRVFKVINKLVTAYSRGYGMIALIRVSLTIFNMLENSRSDSF